MSRDLRLHWSSFTPFCYVPVTNLSILRSIHASSIKTYCLWIISKVAPPPKATLSWKPSNVCQEQFFHICFLVNISPWKAERSNIFVFRYRKKANKSVCPHGTLLETFGSKQSCKRDRRPLRAHVYI